MCVQGRTLEGVPDGVLSFFGLEPERVCLSSPPPDDDSDWREEVAQQAGMGLGIEAYNDALGQSASEPVEEPSPPPGSRWRCPRCGGEEVQIALPTWYREAADGALTQVSIDDEADPLCWCCDECLESDGGTPIRHAPNAPEHPLVRLRRNIETQRQALLDQGARILTVEAERTLPPHIIASSNFNSGFDANADVLLVAAVAGVRVRCEDGAPVYVSRLDDVDDLPETEHPVSGYSDIDAAADVQALGFALIELPDFVEGSRGDDGSRCSDGGPPRRAYVVASLDDDEE